MITVFSKPDNREYRIDPASFRVSEEINPITAERKPTVCLSGKDTDNKDIAFFINGDRAFAVFINGVKYTYGQIIKNPGRIGTMFEKEKIRELLEKL